ncbi:MAG: efflux RND transporter periplasmic adaptor subunit, partial [Sphingobacterium sp.]
SVKHEKLCLDAELKKIIDTTAVAKAEGNETLKLTGNVSYDENKVYRFVPLLSGVIRHVHFSLGDFVKKGQILLEIRSADLNDMSANLREAKIKLKVAQRQLNATQNLYADGVASDKEVLEAQSDVGNVESEIKKIGESLAMYGGNIESGVLTVKAQSSGFIVEKNVVDGQQIESGNDPLFVIGDLSKVWVMANVYAGNISEVKNGLTVDIETTAYPDKIFKGVITRISNVVDVNEKVLKAIIALDNPDQLLKPEMMTTINVHLSQKSNMVSIPQHAVVFDNETYHIVKINNDCDLQIIDFVPDYENNNCYFTSSPEIKPGDNIIQKNSLLVYNKLIGK